ncbi:MAG: alpha/beta hydrolase fold domain-containing protein [Myxococcales bacterium]|nr:alpha/beta hydrolase fold domain-containing protein [Myxococcales bacterium]
MREAVYVGGLLSMLWLVACGGGGPSATGGGTGVTGGGAGGGVGSDAGTGGGGEAVDAGETPPVVAFMTSPVPGLPVGARYALVSYGADPAQVMDVFLPDADSATAAIIFFHGGGFTRGSRTAGYDGVVRSLSAGVAFFAVDYRLLRTDGTEDEGVTKPLTDSRTAVQFIRRWASLFNVDGARLGAYGGSAGAGTSLWLAYHPDMANPDAGTLLERQSTRLQAVAALSTQATYDVVRWSSVVYGAEYPLHTNDVLLQAGELRDAMVRFYGLDSSLAADAGAILEVLAQPKYVAYRAEVDMLQWMSADDPPTYVENLNPDVDPLQNLLHHPLHGMTVLSHALDAGIEVTAKIPAYNVHTSDAGAAVEFLLGAL